MKRGGKLIALIVAAVLGVSLLLFSMTYSVPFYEVAIVTTFGEAEGADAVQLKPGLHLKAPTPIQGVRLYDRRLQLVDTRLETQATRDGRQVLAQAFVFWQIDSENAESVLKFSESFGSIARASEEIELRMRSAVSALSEFTFADLVGPANRLAEAEERIQARLVAGGGGTPSLAELGVRVNRVGLSQVMVPVEVTKAVISRMIEERNVQANNATEAGNAAAQRIKSGGAEDASRILAFADRVAAVIRAQGDSLATTNVAVMAQDPDLAKLLIWLDALETSMSNNSTLFIPTTLAPFHLLNVETPEFSNGIPVPPARESGDHADQPGSARADEDEELSEQASNAPGRAGEGT